VEKLREQVIRMQEELRRLKPMSRQQQQPGEGGSVAEKFFEIVETVTEVSDSTWESLKW